MVTFSGKIPFLHRELLQTTLHIVVLSSGRSKIAPLFRLRIGDYRPYVREMTLAPKSSRFEHGPLLARRSRKTIYRKDD